MSLALYWVSAARFSSQSRSAACDSTAHCSPCPYGQRVTPKSHHHLPIAPLNPIVPLNPTAPRSPAARPTPALHPTPRPWALRCPRLCWSPPFPPCPSCTLGLPSIDSLTPQMSALIPTIKMLHQLQTHQGGCTPASAVGGAPVGLEPLEEPPREEPPQALTSTDTALSALFLLGVSGPVWVLAGTISGAREGLLLLEGWLWVWGGLCPKLGMPRGSVLAVRWWRLTGGLGGISSSSPLLKSVSGAIFLGDWLRLLGGVHTPSSTCLQGTEGRHSVTQHHPGAPLQMHTALRGSASPVSALPQQHTPTCLSLCTNLAGKWLSPNATPPSDLPRIALWTQ